MMTITTTPSLEGKKIKQYIGPVSGSSIIGTNFMRDFFARVADFTGGKIGAYESELKKARSGALSELRAEASRLGANAIIGVDFDFECLGEKGSILMVNVTGTAVIVE